MPEERSDEHDKGRKRRELALQTYGVEATEETNVLRGFDGC